MKKILDMDYHTVKETAVILGITDLTVRRYLASKKLSSRKIGREHFISDTDIQDFLNRKA